MMIGKPSLPEEAIITKGQKSNINQLPYIKGNKEKGKGIRSGHSER